MNTTYFLNCVAGNVFGSKADPAIPQHYYVGLSTQSLPLTGAMSRSHPRVPGYGRVSLDGRLGEPSDGVVENSSSIDFNESTASWGTITHFVIYDNETVGEGTC